MKTNRNEHWSLLHDRFQQASDIDASRRATFLDHVSDTDSELRNELEALLESDTTPGWLKGAVDRAGVKSMLRKALEILKRKTTAQSFPVAAAELSSGE